MKILILEMYYCVYSVVWILGVNLGRSLNIRYDFDILI